MTHKNYMKFTFLSRDNILLGQTMLCLFPTSYSCFPTTMTSRQVQQRPYQPSGALHSCWDTTKRNEVIIRWFCLLAYRVWILMTWPFTKKFCWDLGYSGDGHWSSFQLDAIINSAALNILVGVFAVHLRVFTLGTYLGVDLPTSWLGSAWRALAK